MESEDIQVPGSTSGADLGLFVVLNIILLNPKSGLGLNWLGFVAVSFFASEAVEKAPTKRRRRLLFSIIILVLLVHVGLHFLNYMSI